MKHLAGALIRIIAFLLVLYLWSWVIDQRVSSAANLSIIVGGVLLVFPAAWLGRRLLDGKPTAGRAAWITTFVHYAVVIMCGVSILRAVTTYEEWSGWTLPVPREVGLALAFVTGAASLLAVANLALRGLGAPFAIALSRKLAADGLYAWTRNPMVLATLAFFLSLGIWFQSALFLLWVLVLLVPALLFIVRVFEERELELRFGMPYLEYKSRTPMLFPRRPTTEGKR
jgi:protein-S-isoprenylcysteine O-methyltransferase Ste14